MLSKAPNLISLLGLLALLLPHAAQAGSQACDKAARKAAVNHGVPVDVLLALTRTETGRSRGGELQPWPWTVNIQGKGYWFASKSEALTFATLHHDAGARSFDVGCFQVNFKWHGHAFRSISDMFDPDKNANYAALFLKDLKHGSNGWSDAAGAYHSRTPELKARYQARFEDIFAVVRSKQPHKAESKPTKENHYPLMQTGHRGGALGSLFGGQSRARKPLISIGTPS